MKKKNIFITGATSGMGLNLLKIYHQQGHRVGTLSIEDKQDIKEILPKGVFYRKADVTNHTRVSRAIKDFSAKGGLDIVVANAGISLPKAKIPDFERGRKVIQTNVIGVMNTFEASIPLFKRKKRGELYALSSVAATINGVPGMAIYSASKAAVFSFCQSMHVDLKSFGIHVGVIAPGFVKTPLTANNKHSMPFSISMEEAVEEIYRAIEKKKAVHIFPRPMRYISAFANGLPYEQKLALLCMDFLGTGKH